MRDLYEKGWRQGSVFNALLPASWLALTLGGPPQPMTQVFGRWVVCTQDCDLKAAATDSKETQVEVRPVLEADGPVDWGIRSRRIRLTERDHVNSASPRLLITAELLASFEGPSFLLSDARAKAFKTWLGLRYDRAAVPEHLVPLAKEVAGRCGTRSGRAAAEDVHEVLMQFDDSASPPKVALFAVVADTADKQVVRSWLSEAALRIDPEIGVVAHIDVATKAETSLVLIENSYAADLSQLTWRGEHPFGADQSAFDHRTRTARKHRYARRLTGRQTPVRCGANDAALELFEPMIGPVSTIWDVSEMASPTASVIDVANPRRGDRAVAASFRAWLSEMDETGPIELPISACDELAAARADDDV